MIAALASVFSEAFASLGRWLAVREEVCPRCKSILFQRQEMQREYLVSYSACADCGWESRRG